MPLSPRLRPLQAKLPEEPTDRLADGRTRLQDRCVIRRAMEWSLNALGHSPMGDPSPRPPLNLWPFWPQIAQAHIFGRDMQTLSARDAKYNFGRLIDTARAEPVTVEKHGRPVVIVLAVEEYQRLKMIELEHRAATVAPVPPT